jgi:L-fuculose-phosphate aldolase
MTGAIDLRKELAACAREIHARGWVANHDGNLTARLDDGRFICTPTAISKRLVTESMLLVVDREGRKLSGRMRPFSELGLHLTVLAERKDARVVLHAHPPTATGFAVAGIPLDSPTSPEVVVSLGAGIPTVPYAGPGAAAEAALRPYLHTTDTVLLANHGALTWGPDVETAFLRMELVEHVAKTTLVAHQLGGAVPLPQADVEALLAKRHKAGLDPPGARAPAAGTKAGAAPAAPAASAPANLAAIINEEVLKALGGGSRKT